MCGFVGKISKCNIDNQNIIKANQSLICRGPDETVHKQGSLSDFNHKSSLSYSLVFNRLSIIDLSDKASQPMYSNEFNTMILFNGEIYNHRDLRKDLENQGIKFFSNHSDTEVLLNGLSFYGDDFLGKLVGQFAIAFLDMRNMKLKLIKDRVGQKPLFYKIDNQNITFSSNLKTLVTVDNDNEVDKESYIDFLNYGVVPSPKTIFKNVYKLRPAEILTIDLNEDFLKYKTKIYWNLKDFVSNKKFQMEEFENLFNSAVQYRTESDVDFGALLSGGLDSTSIVKSLNFTSAPVNTFSIGYKDTKYDESKWFTKVADYFNTNSEKVIMSINEINDELENAEDSLDEPYFDPSVLPSYIVAKKISQHYKVVLTGDGGDELMGGYLRFQNMITKRKINKSIISLLYRQYPWHFGTGNRIASLSKDLTFNYLSYFSDKKLLAGLKISDSKNLENNFITGSMTNPKDFMLFDFKFYLSEMMMLKVDRTSMANSVEARSPFVDHRLIEYMLSCDISFLNSNSKYPLKKYLGEDFSTDFLDRKKMGFVFNLEDWVYSNSKKILSYLEKQNTFNIFEVDSLKMLEQRKSRINAQRIWKIYTIEKYLNKFI